MAHTNLAISRGMLTQHLHAATLPVQEMDHCAIVLDSHGVITSCCEATGAMFGSSVCNLVGKTIWYLISNMTPSYTSPSFNARYIAAMSKDSRWRRFQAVDMHGQRFPVEVSLSSVEEDDSDLFLLILRRPAGEPAKQSFNPI